MVQPVHRTVLKVRERIVPRGARQLVLAEHGLLLPRMALLDRIGAGLRPAPVATLHRLTPVAPGRDPARIDDLALDVKAGDQKVVAGVLQILEYRARILSHEDGVRGVVVDAELVPDAVPLTDAVERDPGTRGIGDVVVPRVADGPSRHRTLLDAVGESPCLRFLEQRHEHFLEHHEVRVETQGGIAADEAGDRIRPEEDRGVEHAPHELVLPVAHRLIGRQHVVEVRQVRKSHAGRLHCPADARRAGGAEGLAQIQRVRHGIEKRGGGHVALGGMQGRGQLDVRGPDLPGELQPLLDAQVGVCVAPLPRSQLLERRGQDAEPHRSRPELSRRWFGWHKRSSRCGMSPRRAQTPRPQRRPDRARWIASRGCRGASTGRR